VFWQNNGSLSNLNLAGFSERQDNENGYDLYNLTPEEIKIVEKSGE